MRVRLSLRKERVSLEPFTGITFCGCRYLNGDIFEHCREHRIGKHRGD